jgi:hypothetical protein
MLDLPPCLEPIGQVVGVAAGHSANDGGEGSEKHRSQKKGGGQKND